MIIRKLEIKMLEKYSNISVIIINAHESNLSIKRL